MELSALRIYLLPIWIHIAALFSSRRLEVNDWRKGLIVRIIEVVGGKMHLNARAFLIMSICHFLSMLDYFVILGKLDRYIAV